MQVSGRTDLGAEPISVLRPVKLCAQEFTPDSPSSSGLVELGSSHGV